MQAVIGSIYWCFLSKKKNREKRTCLFQGIAVTQLCHMMEDVKLFGTASYQKHEAVKANVDHLFDHVVDYPQEVRK